MAANSPTGSTLERVRSARFIEAASRNEQFYSASRLALCTAALARNVWLSTAGATPASEGLTLQIGLVSALAAVSIVLLIASCRGPISLQLRLLSAGADLAVITAALAQNAGTGVPTEAAEGANSNGNDKILSVQMIKSHNFQ